MNKPKTFKCVKGWKTWNVGDVLMEYEYNRLPHEQKIPSNFIEITHIEEKPTKKPSGIKTVEVKPAEIPVPDETIPFWKNNFKENL